MTLEGIIKQAGKYISQGLLYGALVLSPGYFGCGETILTHTGDDDSSGDDGV